MRKISLIILTCLVLNSCSFFTKGKKEESTPTPTDSIDFGAEEAKAPQEEIKVEEAKAPQTEIKVEEQEVVKSQAPDELTPAENEVKESSIANTPNDITIKDSSGPTSPDSGKEAFYKIQKGDTLMMIAFKIYGDYHKWKDMKKWNMEKLKTKMNPGDSLKYITPEKAFTWQPSGLPYVTKTGDTLGIISKDKYGTPKKWKSIYENNRPLIQDPNLIFAGFTIYYVPVRDVASEKK